MGITRSAALRTNGKKSATSFQIQLSSLKGDEKAEFQIVVLKLQSNAKPIDHPGNDLQPYNVNTVDNQPYIAAQLDGTNINQNRVFTVGDGKKYASSSTRKRRSTNYQNVQLEPETYYSVFQRTFKSADLYYDSDWMDVIKTDELLSTKTSPTEKLSPTKVPSTPLTMVTIERVTTKQSGGGDASTGAEDGEKYLAGIIVLIILVVILLVILAYFIYQNRRRKSLKANPENKSEDKNNSEEIDENPDNDDANYELVENEGSAYTALKRPGTGEEESDGHLYTHLIQVHTDYMIPNETGF